MPTPPDDYYVSWHILYAQQGNVWLCLTRGVPGNDQDFYLAWGKNKEILADVFEPENKNHLVDRNLSELASRAKTQHDIDLFALPLENWQER